jgi:hypothetical protein
MKQQRRVQSLNGMRHMVHFTEEYILLISVHQRRPESNVIQDQHGLCAIYMKVQEQEKLPFKEVFKVLTASAIWTS